MVRGFELKDLHVICTDAPSNPLFRMPKNLTLLALVLGTNVLA